MSNNNYNRNTNNGFMLFSMVLVMILSSSVSVVLYLFLAKNGSNSREIFKTKFDEKEVNDKLIEIKNIKSDINRFSKIMEAKSVELDDIKIAKNKLVGELGIATDAANKRKTDQKIVSIKTPIGELPPDPVLGKTEIKELIETIDDNSKKIDDAKKFDEKILKNSPIGLNEELKKFISNKEKESLNNPTFKATYGRDWLLIVNDLKNAGKNSVDVQLKISQISEFPKTKEGAVGLKTLLSQTKDDQLNYYFAFDYFPRNLENKSLEELKIFFNIVTPLAPQEKLSDKEMNDKDKVNSNFKKNVEANKNRGLEIETNAKVYLEDIKKYKEFRKILDTENK